MTHVGYLIAGWGIVFGVCGLYAIAVLRRSRRLLDRVPADRARWMTTDDADRIGES
ncbi:MAG: hypothetical protein ACR2P0_02685 [Acidimicrobiales bacterium]